jgi:photosystem II stability/assembly factor-like uncharacterized protein
VGFGSWRFKSSHPHSQIARIRHPARHPFAGSLQERGPSVSLAIVDRTKLWRTIARDREQLHPKVWVVRTTDSGRHWRAVMPPVKRIASATFLGAGVALIEADSLHPGAPGAPRTEPVYRTLDGGRSWQQLSHVQSDCQLDFVNRRDGWCITVGDAMGSSTVWLYRTIDGGATWRLVSHTGLAGVGSTPGALPYGCDKTIAFTSPLIGWAAGTCNKGAPRLYGTTGAGRRWHELGALPIPKGMRLAQGSTLSLPAVRGSWVAVSLQVLSSQHGTTIIATSPNRGRTWHSRIAPGQTIYGSVDLVNVRRWVLSNGSTLLRTRDAGQHWKSLKGTAKLVRVLGTPLTLDFPSPSIGFAGPNINGGPMWWTRNGGTTWKRIKIAAGPFTLG